MHGLKSAIDRGADAWARSLPGRVLDRYVSRSGPLLANGLAYGLLFAFFAGVWIAVSVFGLIMVGNIDWQQMLIDAVREVIPGVADSFLTSSALGAMSSALTWTGLATLAIFWWTVTGWMNSLRHAVRAMFDDCGDELNIVVARLRDTLAAIAIAILFILSTAAGTVSGGIVRRLLQWGGIPSSSLPGTVLLGDDRFRYRRRAEFCVVHVAAARGLPHQSRTIHDTRRVTGISDGFRNAASRCATISRSLPESDACPVRRVDRRAHLVQPRRPGHFALCRPHCRVSTKELSV